ncbi:hypothetical protein [Amycolatopsis marina]|uniref:hypothetical protein n=1 Tax=Amycolatopsis marina TaxID=490629 RepID=UPI00116041AB|nr:hypothetical protein [Amycolatopsis marina]
MRDSGTRHSITNGVSDGAEYKRVPTGFFIFALDGCASAVDASIGADGIGTGKRGISLFRTIAFTAPDSRLGCHLVEA